MIIKDKLRLEEGDLVPSPSSSRREKQHAQENSFYLAGKIRQKELYEASILLAGGLDDFLNNRDLLEKISLVDKPTEVAGLYGRNSLGANTSTKEP